MAHFAVDVFVDNFLEHIAGRPMDPHSTGTPTASSSPGNGKGLLIDFNYDVEPLPGKYPLPGIGPFSLLKETEANHWGKLMFKWTYWNVLLPGRELPLAGADVDGRQGPVEVAAMTITDPRQPLDALEAKLDPLTDQMAVLTADANRRRVVATCSDLQSDLMPVPGDVLQGVDPGTRRAVADRRPRRHPPTCSAASSRSPRRSSGRSSA